SGNRASARAPRSAPAAPTAQAPPEPPPAASETPRAVLSSLLLPFRCAKVCDTSPFLLHRPRLALVANNESRGRKLHRRYADVATTGEKGQPFHFRVLGGVQIAVVNRAAHAAPPDPIRECELGVH